MTLQSALLEIKRLKPQASFSYWALAKKHKCSSTTLTENHKGRRTSYAESQLHQRLLHPRDEAELVQYIRGLTERHIPPTRQTIINFATPLCRWEPSYSWVTRLLKRYPDTLTTAWTTTMDTDRHDADNSESDRAYFELLHTRMTEFDVLLENTYNMDEKGFMIGVLGKTKRVFDKVLHKQRRFKQASHDGNRDWVTAIGAICADGTTLPPAVSFQPAETRSKPTGSGKSNQRSIHCTLECLPQAGRTIILVLSGSRNHHPYQLLHHLQHLRHRLSLSLLFLNPIGCVASQI